MENPLVSVVVVSYNQAQYIVQNLDAIKSQTYSNWELIVADDASSDDSVPVFKKWLQENNIPAKEIFHPKNTGLATVLNEAVELCAGEYVKLIAADDYLHPECLEKSVRCLEEKGKEYGMVFTDTFCVDENSHFLRDIADYNRLGNIPPEEFRKELIKGNRIAALTVLMRTSVVKETGKYDARFVVEDYFRWLKISQRYFIAYIPEKLTYYRLHDENISKTKAERIATECMMLQLMFDQDGVLKDRINHFFNDQYILRQEIPVELVQYFNNYPFGMKLLKFCINNNVPTFVFRIIYSISRRMNLKLR